jgi:hypothetical protein
MREGGGREGLVGGEESGESEMRGRDEGVRSQMEGVEVDYGERMEWNKMWRKRGVLGMKVGTKGRLLKCFWNGMFQHNGFSEFNIFLSSFSIAVLTLFLSFFFSFLSSFLFFSFFLSFLFFLSFFSFFFSFLSFFLSFLSFVLFFLSVFLFSFFLSFSLFLSPYFSEIQKLPSSTQVSSGLSTLNWHI